MYVAYNVYYNNDIVLYLSFYYLTGNDIMYEYDPKVSHVIYVFDHVTHQVIGAVQDQLVPDRCNIMILSREYSKECKLKEKWFGTRYSSEGKL